LTGSKPYSFPLPSLMRLLPFAPFASFPTAAHVLHERPLCFIILKDAAVVESDEEKKGVILDYDETGDVVSLEILDAKNRVTKPTEMVYELTGQAGLVPNEAQV